MSAGPRTGREALLAEILGDVDVLLKHVDASRIELERVSALIISIGEGKTQEFNIEIETSLKKVASLLDAKSDDFASVVNQAVVKFNEKICILTEKVEQLNSESEKPKIEERISQPINQYMFAGAILFTLGVAAGIAAMLIIK